MQVIFDRICFIIGFCDFLIWYPMPLRIYRFDRIDRQSVFRGKSSFLNKSIKFENRNDARKVLSFPFPWRTIFMHRERNVSLFIFLSERSYDILVIYLSYFLRANHFRKKRGAKKQK